MKSLRVVMKKELDRVFHDRKLVFSLFILPAVLMIALYGLMGMMMSRMIEDIEEHVPVVHAVDAPEDLKALIRESGWQVDWAETDRSLLDDAKEAVREGEIDLLIVFPEDFSARVASYQAGQEIPEIRTFYNPTSDYSKAAHDQMTEGILKAYESRLLTDRFGDLSLLTPFVVDSPQGQQEESSAVTKEGQESGQLLRMLFPYLVVMLLFTGPMSLGVDAIAGEKERGTLASMLITPTPRRDIVLGKLLSLEILSFLSALVYAVSMLLAIPLLGMSVSVSETGTDSLPISVSFSLVSALEIFAVMLALVFLYVAVVALLSIRAKSVKEASSYISIIYIAVIAAGMMTMFSGNFDPPLWRYAVPVYGSALSLQKLITGGLSPAAFFLSVGATLLVGLLLTWMIICAIDDERVVLNA